MKRVFKKIKSPIGDIYLVASDEALEGLLYPQTWPKYKSRNSDLVEGDNAIIKKTISQLAEYWKGKRQEFDIPLNLKGTEFQIKAWKALTKIPFGKTKSYKEQALAIKAEKAVRAVGTANGRNPISIIVPCHRVIGANARLTGYAGGLTNKEFLLSLEKASFKK
ncbi:MAG: methylated-DNA--[protein]-cysteine S-methyltransferase [Bdellovibrionota bacterium]